MWRFSDGTEVDPGGEVRGTSLFAQSLRASLEWGASIQIWAPPSNRVELDLTHTGHINQWLNEAIDRETRIKGNKLTMTERHSPLQELPPPPWKPEDLVEGRVY